MLQPIMHAATLRRREIVHRIECVALGGLNADGYDIWSELQTLEGPSVCYGPEGILIGKEEDLEIKEYDSFDMCRDALAQSGLDKEL